MQTGNLKQLAAEVLKSAIDHVFFFNIKNYIQLNKFQVSNDTIILNLELFINKRSTENINIILGKKRESWRIKKKKVTPTAAKL